MEDRFKIRAFHHIKKKMFYLDEYWNNDWYDSPKLPHSEVLNNNNKTISPLVNHINGTLFTLMQSTGLKDSEGNLIYQDDVVNFSLFYFNGVNSELDLNGIIRWSDNYCGFYIELLNTTKDFKYVEEDDAEGNKSVEISHLSNGSDIKILGNIYENSELLCQEIK